MQNETRNEKPETRNEEPETAERLAFGQPCPINRAIFGVPCYAPKLTQSRTEFAHPIGNRESQIVNRAGGAR